MTEPIRTRETDNAEDLVDSSVPSLIQRSEMTRGALQVTGTAFVVLFCIVGMALWGLPFYYDFMVQQFGWTRGQVTSGNALSKLVVGPLFGFIAGWMVDRFGPRRLMMAGILMAGTALVGLGSVSSLGMFYFFYVFNALGYVCGGPLPNQVLLSQWFDKSRGKAKEKAAIYQAACRGYPQVLAFELGQMFAANGEIFDDETVRRLMDIPEIKGMKHSSLDRLIELERLALRDKHRADFRIYTGNDLGINMIEYGSDYLLGLATFAPEKFAERDRLWESGDPAYYALSDALQHLGNVAFREPVPAYKHPRRCFCIWWREYLPI